MSLQIHPWFARSVVALMLMVAGCGGIATSASVSSVPATPAGSSAKPAASVPASASGSTAASQATGGPSGSRSVGPVASTATTYVPGAVLNPPVTVKAGMAKTAADSPMVLADKRGYLKAEGLELQTTVFSNTQDALPPLGAGQLDVMVGGSSPAIFNAVARGVNVQIVADGGSQAPGSDWFGLAVRTDLIDSGRYKRPSDLKGLKIGIPAPFTVVHYMLKVLLEKNGLTLNDVDVAALGVPGEVTALGNKGIDAMVNIEPFLSQVEQQGSGKVVVRSLEATPKLVSGIFMMSPEFPAKQPEAARRYMVAWLRGVRDYLDAFSKGKDQEQTAKLLQESGILLNAKTQNPTFNADGVFDPAGLQELLVWYTQEKAITGQVDLNKVVNFQLVKDAARKLPPYQR